MTIREVVSGSAGDGKAGIAGSGRDRSFVIETFGRDRGGDAAARTVLLPTDKDTLT